MSLLTTMTINPDYTEYLISAINDESATELADQLGLTDSNWFRLPSSLNDETEAYKKHLTEILSKEEWASFSEDEYKERSLSEYWDERLLFGSDHSTAAKYAAARNWSLRTWKFISDPELGDEVIEYAFYS